MRFAAPFTSRRISTASTLANEQLFKEAREQFLGLLPDSERSLFSNCPTAEQLIADVRKLSDGAKNRAQGRRVVGSVKAFRDTLQPYFQIIDIFVSSNPQYAAIVWGAVRLIFQLASNYISFFEKLAKVLDRITYVLPQYDQISALCANSPSKRLQSSLGKVYEDLLRFCQSLVRVFTRKDGRARKIPIVIAGLFWKSFDARFEDTLDDFKYHADLVKSELLLAQLFENKSGKEAIIGQIQELKERMRNAEKARAERDKPITESETRKMLGQEWKHEMLAKFDRIQRWISPPQFAQEYERARDQREQGTAEWLFEEPMFSEWLKYSTNESGGEPLIPGKCVLWVQGNPGCGKTILAASTIEELRGLRESHGLKLQVFYSFFRSAFAELQDTLAPLRSFLAQLFYSSKEDAEIIDKFAFIMDEASSGQLVASHNELLELLQLCTESSKNTFLVVDGVDECDDSAAVTKDLLALATHSYVKVIIFSRPNVAALYSKIPEQQRLNIGRRNCKDIEMYLTTKLGDMVESRLLPSETDTLVLVKYLMLGANGMFLWARLMLSFLNSPALTRRQRLDTIMNVQFPEGLRGMYDRIANYILRCNQVEQGLCRKVITWLLYSMRPMTAQEVQVAVSPISSGPSAENDDELPDFARVVIICCGGLVELQKIYSTALDSEISSFQFIHLSVREYLSAQESRGRSEGNSIDSSPNQISTPLSDSLIDMANQCMLVLSYRLPSQPLSSSAQADISPSSLYRAYPLCGYAAVYWIEHLHQTMSNGCFRNANLPQLLETLSKFLGLKCALTAYIEASYALRAVPNRALLLEWVEGLHSISNTLVVHESTIEKVADDSLELYRYLGALHLEWGVQLLRSPKCIWEEATAFTPSRLLVQSASTQVWNLIMDPPKNEFISSRYLSKISEVSSDGKMVAILSIWPSKAYESHAQYSMRPVASMIYNICGGWLARYEIWTITDDPVCVADICIPLDSSEVHLQLQRSLWQDDPSWTSGTLKLQFPLAISSNIHLIAILKTVYLLTVTGGQEVRMNVVPLPLGSNPEKPFAKNMQDSLGSSLGEQPERKKSTGLGNYVRDFLRPSSTSRQHARSRSQETIPPSNPDLAAKNPFGRRPRSFRRSRSPGDDFDFTGNRLNTYWVSFDRRVPFLVLLDASQRHLDNSNDICGALSLFKVQSEGGLKISLSAISGPIRLPSRRVQLGSPKVVIHDREPALVLFFPEVKGDNVPVILWVYSQVRFSPLSLFITSEWMGDAVQDVHFSNCGNYVVIQSTGASVPEVVPIDWGELTSGSQPTLHGGQRGDAPDNTMIIISPNTGPVIRAPDASSEAIARGGTSVADNNHSTGLSVVHTSSEISIRRWQSEGEGTERETKQEVLQLTKLPAWKGLASSSVVLSMPRSKDDAVKVVLNKAAAQWEDMIGEVDANLPALVSRDPGTLTLSSSGRSLGMVNQATNWSRSL